MKKVERLNKKGKTVSTILKLQRCLIDIFDNLWYNYHNVSANASFERERRKTLAVLKLAFCFIIQPCRIFTEDIAWNF